MEEDPTNGNPYLAHLVPGKPDIPDSVANPSRLRHPTTTLCLRGGSLVPSSAPTVEVQQAGQSYNPLYEDHQALLAAAVETEVLEDEVLASLSVTIFISMTILPRFWAWFQFLEVLILLRV